ncbi:LPS export ABC transporter periplasmic protein LptC [Phormidium tenue FACHB-886]|nr:LPS export ABC transporter periplasmic protein LptC [Phormidium tenue FACHB-886]
MVRFKFAVLPLLLLVISTSACRQASRGADRLAEDSSAAQQVDTNLTFNNITLEQPDEQGRILWKVKAEEATYSPDQKVASVRNPDGEIYQDGKPIYHIQARQGEVEQNGDRIFLRGQVVATDIKSGAVLRGDELEWRPKPDTLIIRGNLRGTHPKLRLSANQAKLQNKQRRMDLSGQVIALTQQDPKARLQSDHIIWEMDKELVISDRPTQVQRIQDDKAIDQAEAKQAEANLATRTVTLRQDANLVLFDPPLQVASDLLIWELSKQTVSSPQPVRILHRQQQITATANQGQMDLKTKVGRLTGNVDAVDPRNQSQLAADRLTWNIPTQQMDAEGNISYSQADPPATLRGAKAAGRLDNKTMVVRGGADGGDGRVVTEIVPETLN